MPSEGSPASRVRCSPLCLPRLRPAGRARHALWAPECARLLDALHDAEARLDAGRQAVSDAMHAPVGQAQDPELRRTLLNLRHNLYNLRFPPRPAWTPRGPPFPPTCAARWMPLPRCCGEGFAPSFLRTAARRWLAIIDIGLRVSDR
jgi:hypothetical protein